jgi:UDP-N-acetylglucosamine--N-acetylmuramyl-(pentapeptide) pyrophosphoryl-undecaprenol N-acetylglucosamine transferase
MSIDTQNKINRVIISGGGTGGHIFPALSIAGEIRRRFPDAKILFVGALGRMEMERVPAAGYEIVGLPVAGFDRRRPWRNFKVLFKLFKSMRTARRLVKDFKPDMAIGVGGYASGPTLKAAQRLGVPTFIQEQNSYAGVTNKLLAKKAVAIYTAYDDMDRFFPAEKITKTGNPVRASLLASTIQREDAKRQLGFSTDRPLILTVGGSLGALTVNRAIAASLDKIQAAGANLLWQTGRYGADEAQDAAKGRDGVIVTKFITDMATAYRAADIVISRAGAGTISELQLLGCPSILIPSPNVAENHQYKNAMALVKNDAAILVTDADAVNTLGDTVVSLLADSSRRFAMSQNISAMALNDAAAHIVDGILSHIK